MSKSKIANKKTSAARQPALHKASVSSSRKIIKLTSKDAIPTNAKFLYAKEEFQGMYGWVSNLQPHYQTIFYYEVDGDCC
jgi:hypothetical protein